MSKKKRGQNRTLPPPEILPSEKPATMKHVTRESARHWTVWCLYLFALAWPLGSWQRIVGPVHLHHLAMAPLFLACFKDWQHKKRLATPFELFWPCAAIAAGVVVLRCGGSANLTWSIPFLCALFVVLYHVTEQPETIWRAMQLSLTGGVLMVLLGILSRFGILFPTVFSVENQMVMAGPLSMREGSMHLGLLLLLPPTLFIARRCGECQVRRYGPWLEWLLPLLTLVFVLLPAPPQLHGVLDLPGCFLWPALPVTLAGLWGCARIAAKLRIADSHIPRDLAVYLPLFILAGALIVLLAGVVPTAGVVLLLALAAARAKPRLESGFSMDRKSFMIAIPLALVMLINLLSVRHNDPRNYEQYALAALKQEEYKSLREYLGFIKKQAPSERRADYYEARAFLGEGRFAEAANAFARSLGGGRSRLLPPPGEQEINTFLDEMRDLTSALPEPMRGIAYEKSLAAAGRDRHALSLLEIRGDSKPLEGVNTAPLAEALAALLDAPQLRDALLAWNPGLLAAILETAGPFNEIRGAPPGFPETQLPLVVLAKAGETEVQALAFAPGGAFGGVKNCPSEIGPQTSGRDMLPSLWDVPEQQEDGWWRMAYGTALDVMIGPHGHLRFHGMPIRPVSAITGDWDMVLYLPDWENEDETILQ